MFKFIHAADIHLDSPLRGLENYEGAPVAEIRGAARSALSNLVDLAIEENVDFVLISGDIYDGDWRDYNTGLYFISQAQRLGQADIPLYLISGNHDAANRMTRKLRLPENVEMFPTGSAGSAIIEDLDVAIHGQSFATAAVYDDLSQDYPLPVAGCFNIGMLHTCATGKDGHERYAPCSVEGLCSKGYDYWALGHIHQRETLLESPYIAFSGNIQGRHARETGPKGCLLVTVDDDRSLKTEFHALDVVRWEVLRQDVSDLQNIDEVLNQITQAIEEHHGNAEGRLLALRVELTGTGPIHRELHAHKFRWINEIRSIAIDAGKGDVWIEKLKLLTSDRPQRQIDGTVSDDAIGELISLFETARSNPDGLSDLGFDLSDIIRKLPSELKSQIPVDDPAWLTETVNSAESLLLSRIVTEDNQ